MYSSNHRHEVLHPEFRRIIKRVRLDMMRVCEQNVTISNAFLKMMSEKPILTAIPWTKRRRRGLTVNWNSEEHCATSRHTNRSELKEM
jgi:hypothetical protein